jgi:hypothetical protein
MNLDQPYWFSWKSIENVEETMNAKYIGYWTIFQKNNWTDEPVDVFYQEKLNSPDHSHYFGLFRHHGSDRCMITNAESFMRPDGIPVVYSNDEIVASHYRHDYRSTSDGVSFIDGGAEYVKSNSLYIGKLSVKDGNFYFSKSGIEASLVELRKLKQES